MKVGVVLLVAIYIYMPNITITKILWEEGFFHIPLQFLKTEVNLQAYCIFMYFRFLNFKVAAGFGTGIRRLARSRMAGNLKERNKKQYASQRCAFLATLSYGFHETFVAWPPNNEGNQQQHQAANDQWLRYKQQEQAENLEHPTTISDNNLHLISV